ncbi:MAG: hypothetical protein WC804_12985 [Sphingomonas sp.]|jgi:hypothetical protein|uniref:hypothetical protein n=1 Tax=Sphingomonas sp. TaxID=28214 RepID=UPI003563FE2C
MDPQRPTASAAVAEPTTSHPEDPAFSLRKIFPSRIALLLLLIPLALLDFYLYLVREGKIAEGGFQPPTGPVEHLVYASIVLYPMLVIAATMVKAIYYLVRSVIRRRR